MITNDGDNSTKTLYIGRYLRGHLDIVCIVHYQITQKIVITENLV